jgi:hypothetical protein
LVERTARKTPANEARQPATSLMLDSFAKSLESCDLVDQRSLPATQISS